MQMGVMQVMEAMEAMKVMKVMKVEGGIDRAKLTRRSVAFLARITSITVITFITATATAADKPFAAPQVAEHVPDTGAGGLAQVTLSLLVVLAAVFAAAWVVRRLRGFGGASSRAIQIIADAPLGTKERAVLIQVGGQQLLVGVAPGQINLLHVLAQNVGDAPPATGDGQQGLAVSVGQARPDFKAILKRSLGL
ncbi:MAG TPA: flagellar biosynthetic protein FliO [Steroidobacteraceae bacterium]|jgi:flagellar protein FliO/FliZ